MDENNVLTPTKVSVAGHPQECRERLVGVHPIDHQTGMPGSPEDRLISGWRGNRICGALLAIVDLDLARIDIEYRIWQRASPDTPGR